MSRIQLDEDIKPLSEFRANVSSFIDKVRETKRPVVITQRGKSAAILLDVSEYEALMQKIELLTDIHDAEKQLADGQGVGHEKAKHLIRSRLIK
jgi:antitoxin YefM